MNECGSDWKCERTLSSLHDVTKSSDAHITRPAAALCFRPLTLFFFPFAYHLLNFLPPKLLVYNSRYTQSVIYIWVELMLWPTVSRPIRLGVGHAFGAYDQIFIFPFFWQTIALLFVLGRPLRREDLSVIWSAIFQWSESWRTHNHTLLSHLRLLVPFPSPLATRRNYGGSILTRLHMGIIYI
jgi:hypothetical protein